MNKNISQPYIVTSSNKGAILIWMAFVLPVSLVLLSLVIDIGYQILILNKLQIAADVGAHTGVIEIRENNNTVLKSTSKQIMKNISREIKLSKEDIQIKTGIWNTTNNTLFATKKNPNAVKVKISTRNNFFFNKHINLQLNSISAVSIAYQNNKSHSSKIIFVK